MAGLATLKVNSTATEVTCQTELPVCDPVVNACAKSRSVQALPAAPAACPVLLVCVRLGPMTSVEDSVVRFIILDEGEFTYTVTAPDDEGTHTFAGLIEDSDRKATPVGGIYLETIPLGCSGAGDLMQRGVWKPFDGFKYNHSEEGRPRQVGISTESIEASGLSEEIEAELRVACLYFEGEEEATLRAYIDWNSFITLRSSTYPWIHLAEAESRPHSTLRGLPRLSSQF